MFYKSARGSWWPLVIKIDTVYLGNISKVLMCVVSIEFPNFCSCCTVMRMFFNLLSRMVEWRYGGKDIKHIKQGFKNTRTLHEEQVSSPGSTSSSFSILRKDIFVGHTLTHARNKQVLYFSCLNSQNASRKGCSYLIYYIEVARALAETYLRGLVVGGYLVKY